MTEITSSNAIAAPLPAPRVPLTIRTATLDDLPFMDALQKRYNKALGYFPTKQFEGYIEAGHVLVAEEVVSGQWSVASESPAHLRATGHSPLTTPLGYIISRDRYLKRDELGVIYQLCVAPGAQRGLIGATLIREVFERAAYGCRLFCCWCAQDLDANYFWESLGFVPIAFRAGSAGKRRVHIFWQRRIDPELPNANLRLPNELNSNRKSQIENRQSTTPYWYPSQTNAGAIREDRLVFPIPPGTHWKEVEAVALPSRGDQTKALPAREKNRKKPFTIPPKPLATASSRLFFGAVASVREAAKSERQRVKKPKTPRVKVKIDPALASAARELRDRCVEHQAGWLTLSPVNGKYDVSRALPAMSRGPSPLALPAAA